MGGLKPSQMSTMTRGQRETCSHRTENMSERSTTGIWLRRGVLAGLGALAGSALILGGLALTLALIDPFGDSPHPSDAAMLAQFKERRAILDQLVEMIGHDPGLERLGLDFTRPEDPAQAGISPDRIALYRKLCLEAGIAKGFQHYGDSIEFLVSTRGLSIAGSAKGFTYRNGADPDATVIDGDLDEAVNALADKSVLLQRRIDGDWWLELDMR